MATTTVTLRMLAAVGMGNLVYPCGTTNAQTPVSGTDSTHRSCGNTETVLKVYGNEYAPEKMERHVMWNCPNCQRPQPFRHQFTGAGLIRKKWRCSYCNALLRGTLIAGTVLPLLLCIAIVILSSWTLSIVISPLSYVVVPSTMALNLIWLNRRLVVVEIDHVVCERCGYDLHGNTSGACPECGQKCRAEAIRNTAESEVAE